MSDKHCARCDTIKNVDDFHRNKSRYDGRVVYCKSCTKEYYEEKEYAKKPEYIEKDRARSLGAYHKMSRDEKIAWNASSARHDYYIKRLYGKPHGWYDHTLASQGFACAICRNPNPPGKERRLAVDHDHACCPESTSCGKCVRGLLCLTCNKRLGILEDIEWREKAVNYLKRDSSE